MCTEKLHISRYMPDLNANYQIVLKKFKVLKKEPANDIKPI